MGDSRNRRAINLNILHVADVLSFGGFETHIATLLNGFINKSNNVYLIGQYIAKEMYDLLDSRIKVLEHKLDYDVYEDFIVNNNIQLLHGHPADGTGICNHLGNKLNLPVIITYHGFYGWNHTIHKNVKNIVTVSKEVSDRLVLTDSTLINKIKIIQNGIDINKFYPMGNNVENTVLFIGRIDADKYYSIKKIISALDGLGITLLVAGHGAYYDNLNAEKPDWVKLLGYVDKMNDVISQSNIVIATGRGVREAMLCGKPCISLDAYGYDGIVKDDTIGGLEYQNFSGRSENKEPLEENIILRDIKYLLNEDIQSDIGKWSREYALDNYDSKIFIDEHLDLYRNLIGGN
jgi:glycosyltransferase involved in cell wall biosynthesis